MAELIHHVDHRRCASYEDGSQLEWLVTNGRGGFAMASINQMLTRRYHGLLIAAVDPPVERFVLLAKLDVSVIYGGRTYELSTNSYVGAIHPHGYRHLESFALHPLPTWRWKIGDAVIEQTLCLVEGEDTVYVRYRLVQGHGPATLSVRPLGTSRHFHILASCLDMAAPEVQADTERILFHWAERRPSWQLSHNGSFHHQPDWYYQFFLGVEAERGYDFKQDLFTPGVIAATLQPDDPAGLVVAASTQDRTWRDYDSVFEASQILARQEEATVKTEDRLGRALGRATKDFLVMRGRGLKTVIAGYPWFTDWGRDTFISLAGLCLVPGRYEDARKIILAFAEHVTDGMIPNRFPDFGEPPAYNTVDATLWYIHAVDRYVAYTGDWPLVAERMFPIIGEILDAHERGTRHGIRLAEDGLLMAGEPGLALTWMDAQLPGCSITPRIGKPVEINALWYNALRIAAGYAERLGRNEQAAKWSALARKGAAEFNRRFWNETTGCLYDVVDVDHQRGKLDSAIRPNQLLAISLTHPVLEPSRWASVVAVCQRDLLTPLGLRTLSPGDPSYRGRYSGDIHWRDGAYHQGTVWPWLMGPFVTAYVRSQENASAARATARKWLEGLVAHLNEAGLGSVSEVADGDGPHRPGGCPWQAWSVAEPLRALCEDILQTHPEAIATPSVVRCGPKVAIPG